MERETPQMIAFCSENPYADKAYELLNPPIGRTGDPNRAAIYATLALAFETRQSRIATAEGGRI